MHPNAQQNQTSMPTDLPPPAQPIPQGTQAGAAVNTALAAAPAQPNLSVQPGPLPSSSVEQRVAERARQLVRQYSNDPYKLNEALGQLKAKFQAEQFRIVSKQTDSR